MKRIIIITLGLILAAPALMAQNAVDALRYSRLTIGGSARYMGMSGAFGALGADFTSASTNPAGLGLYSTSELSITPSVFIGSTKSDLLGTEGSDSRANFNLGNVGLVVASRIGSRTRTSGWKYFQFATGLNRLADFNNRVDMVGINTSNSLLDAYAGYATQNNISITDIEGTAGDGYYGAYPFDLNLAWWTYLLNPSDGGYYGWIPANTTKTQSKTIDTRGSMNEYVFSFASNYSNRLYMGVTFGIPYIRYFENSYYREEDISSNNIYDFNYFTRTENIETRGNGFNFKFGLIYRVNDWVRIGAAFHSPSWFSNMRDNWVASMTADYEIPDSSGYTNYTITNTGYYTYNLTTPWRVQGNLGFVIGNVGLVSADYEYVDYPSARLSAYDYGFRDENRTISNSYRGGHNIRIGTEWRYQVFSFRGGVSYATSPYKNDINDGSILGFSLGVGLRQDWFFMDLAFAHTGKVEDYFLYNLEDVASVSSHNTYRTNTVLLTLGAKF